MAARLLALVVSLLLPVAGAAQYDPRGPPPPPPPGAPPPPVARRPPPPPPPRTGPADSGLTLGLRLGYGIPGGEISDEGDPRLGDVVERKIPIWIELGYRFNPTVWGGVFLEFAPVRVDGTFCPVGFDCDGSSFRFGVDLQLHLAPGRPIDPWIGVGIGAEFLSFDAFDPTVDGVSEFTFSGLEFPLVQAGLDLALSPRFTLGPYVSWSAGYFTGFRVETPGFVDASGRIHDRALHSWLQLGVKATLKL